MTTARSSVSYPADSPTAEQCRRLQRQAAGLCKCGCSGCRENLIHSPGMPSEDGMFPCESNGDYRCEIEPLVPFVYLGIFATPDDAEHALERIRRAEYRIRKLHLFEHLTTDEKWDALDQTLRIQRLVDLWLREYDAAQDWQEVVNSHPWSR